MKIKQKFGKTLVLAVLFSVLSVFAAKAQVLGNSSTTSSTEKTGKGEVTTTSTTSDSLSSSGKSNVSSSGSAGSSAGSTSGTASETSVAASGSSSSAAGSSSSEKEKKSVEFTGLFNSSQIIPNEMAIFCQINGEDFLKDDAKRNSCIDKIALKINNKDSTVRNEGITEYGAVKYAELKTMAGQATTKNAATGSYQEIQNNVGKAISDTKTEHEDNVAIANSVSISTDVINTMRDLLVERLKYDAINGIASIDPNVIKEVEQNEGASSGETSEKSQGSTIEVGEQTSDATKITYTVENPKTTEWRYKGDNMCEREVCTGEGDNIENLQCTTQTEACLDGKYLTSEGSVGCTSGVCTLFKDSDENSDIPCENSSLPTISGYRLVTLATGMCNDGTKNVECPDGKYKVGEYDVACGNGSCSVCLGEVTVTAPKTTGTSGGTSSAASATSSYSNNSNVQEISVDALLKVSNSSSAGSAGSSDDAAKKSKRFNSFKM